MSKPHVAVVACGGTIASEPDTDGAAPAKSGADLIDAVPSVEEYATVSTREVCRQPGFDIRWRDVFETAATVRDAVTAGADGVVVTHGTDTLADTAFALDLLTDLDAPVIVTGAQRRLDEVSSDVGANLTLAVRIAADRRFSSGVHVAFDDEVHAARGVVKTHTNALSTFASPGTGPVATATRAETRVIRPPSRGTSVDPLAFDAGSMDGISDESDESDDSDESDEGTNGSEPAATDVSTPSVSSVPVIHSGTGVDATGIEAAMARNIGGLVIEGTGLGNVTAALGDAIAEAVSSVPVVVTSRTHAGPTEPVYGTPGGGVTLDQHGVLFAHDLPTAKARIALTLGVAAELDRAALSTLLQPTAPV